MELMTTNYLEIENDLVMEVTCPLLKEEKMEPTK